MTVAGQPQVTCSGQNFYAYGFDSPTNLTDPSGLAALLFDGANAVQEISGSTPIANLINGGIDEIFTRADSTGVFTPLQDALGSTIALVNASGGLVTQYAYDPFGNTTFSGATSSNAFQYTGRENEGNGLYFYRARYYSAVLGRFVNEDPAKDGLNFYAYADGDPIDFSDPSGLSAASVLVDAGLTLIRGGLSSGPKTVPVNVVSLAIMGFGAEAAVAAHEVDWFIALHGEQAAYDEEWQSVAAYNQAMIAHPRPPALAGRYTQRDLDWQEYKNRCDTPEPPGLGACTERIMKLQRKIDCRDMRWTWDQKYDPGRHANDINNLSKGIQKDQDWIEKNCK
jgi:RHS repeat-associated protein